MFCAPIKFLQYSKNIKRGGGGVLPSPAYWYHCQAHNACKKLTAGSNNLEQTVRTQLVNSLWTELLQLVYSFVTTCALYPNS